MKPQDFLHVLQRVQLHSQHRQVVMEVREPPCPLPPSPRALRAPGSSRQPTALFQHEVSLQISRGWPRSHGAGDSAPSCPGGCVGLGRRALLSPVGLADPCCPVFLSFVEGTFLW